MKCSAIVFVTLLAIGSAGLPQGVGGQPTAATITSVTGEVELGGAGFQRGTLSKGNERLNIATRLIAHSAGASVALACANGAAQMLTGRFDASISKGDPNTDCAIDLMDGEAFATSNPAAGDNGVATINDKVGLAAAKSNHTQFGVSVRRGDPSASQVYVVEGEATVSRAGSTRRLTNGQMLVATNASIVPISNQKYSSLAANLARIDLQRAGTAVDAGSARRLRQSYESTLRNPTDVNARRALTKEYEVLKIPESAVTRYNNLRISRATAVAPGAVQEPLPPGATQLQQVQQVQ